MLTPRRKGSEYHHGYLRVSAILAGREMIEAHGVNSLGIRKVAEKLRVSPASLYRHFESLNELQAEIATIVRNEIADLMISRRDKAKTKDPALQMFAIGSGYIEYAEKNPKLFEVAFLTCEGYEINPSTDRAWSVLIEGVVRIRKKLPAGIEYLLWSVVHGFATLVAQKAINPREIKARKKEVLDGIGRILK